jgi:hypothetical protein
MAKDVQREFERELYQLMKKHKVKVLMLEEQGAVYSDEEDLSDGLFLIFESSKDN